MMNCMLQETNLEQIMCSANEADANCAFVADKTDPDFKVVGLFKRFEGKEGFHTFALLGESTTMGFISLLPGKEEHATSIGPMYISRKYQGLGLGKLQVIE